MADGTLIAARLLAYLPLLLAAGLPLYRLTEGRASAGAGERVTLALLGLAAIAASCLWAVASVAAMAASPIAALDVPTIQAVLGATPLGTVLLMRSAALGVLLLAALAFPRNAMLALAGGVALAASAWTGHAGAGEGLPGSLHRLSDVIHLLAAATWLGALACFVSACLGRGSDRDRVRALARFAATGTVIVVLLTVTGLANGFFIAAPSGWSPRSGWSLLIGAKVALFLVMLGLAAYHRWRLVPALEAGLPGARGRLLRSLVLETSCAVAIVGLVAFAGMLDPSGA